MVSKMGFEPTGTAFSGLRVYQLHHLDIVVGSAGVEPTSERGDRVQGYSLLPLPTISCQRSDDRQLAESERLERSCPEGALV